MDEFQQVMMMVQKYFPAATEEDVMPIYKQVKEADPNITVDQIEKMIVKLIPEIQKKMGEQSSEAPSDADAKMKALQAMRK